METVESIKRRMSNTQDLHSVVRTMKTMAAVNIRQYERAARSMRRYARTVSAGMQALFMAGRASPAHETQRGGAALGVLALGSDQGMCGRLNEDVAESVAEAAAGHAGEVRVLAMGVRLAGHLSEAGLEPERVWPVPASAVHIASRVRDLLLGFDQWRRGGELAGVDIHSPSRGEGGGVNPVVNRLLPLDRQWLTEVSRRPWPTNQLPLVRMRPTALYARLVNQYLFAEIHAAVSECLASENQSRLESMQGAQKNIEEQLDELHFRYNQARQSSITSELLDIVSGFEAFRD